MTVRAEIRGANELRRAIRRAGKRGLDAVARGLFLEGEAIMADSKPLVPVDEAILRASGFVRPPDRSGQSIVVELGYGGAAKDYAVFVHEGTGPAVGRPRYFPPVSALEGWAARKLGDPKLAYVVARSIHQKGTKPTKFLEKPFKARRRGMERRLARRVRRAMEVGGRG